MGAPQRRRGKVSELGRAPLLAGAGADSAPAKRGVKADSIRISIMLDDRRHVAAEPPTLSYVLGAGLRDVQMERVAVRQPPLLVILWSAAPAAAHVREALRQLPPHLVPEQAGAPEVVLR